MENDNKSNLAKSAKLTLSHIHNFKLLKVEYPSNINEVSVENAKLWNQIRLINDYIEVDNIFEDEDLDLNFREFRILTWKWFPNLNNREEYHIITDMNSWPGCHELGGLFVNNKFIGENNDAEINPIYRIVDKNIDPIYHPDNELTIKFNEQIESFNHIRMLQITTDIYEFDEYKKSDQINKFIYLSEFKLISIKNISFDNLDLNEKKLWYQFLKCQQNNKIIKIIYWSWCPSILILDEKNNDHRSYELIEMIISSDGNEIGVIFLLGTIIFEINNHKVYLCNNNNINQTNSIIIELTDRIKCMNHFRNHKCIYEDKYNPNGKIKNYYHQHCELIDDIIDE